MQILGKKVAIKMDDANDKTTGGIVLTTNEKACTGSVVGLGDQLAAANARADAGVTNETSIVRVGDRVQVHPADHSDSNFHTIGGEKLLVVEAKDLIAKLSPERNNHV